MIYVLNGPNINMLGIREPQIYGKTSYEQLEEMIKNHATEIAEEVCIRQTNSEGQLIDWVQEAYFKKAFGIIINPGGYTHTSIALMDALKAVNLPTVEVHLSDINQREEFRKISYVSKCAQLTIAGHGTDGYLEALDYLHSLNTSH